jgi:PrtD family type I secretion system ABC transporter
MKIKTPVLSSTNPMRNALAACRTGFGATIVFSFGVSALMLVAPIYMLQIYNRVLVSRSVDTLLMLTLIVGVSLLVFGILDVARNFVMVRIGAWLDRKLAPMILTAGIASSVREGTPPSVQGLRDLLTVRNFLSSPMIFAFFDAPWTPLFLAVIFMLHWVLGVLALGGAVVLFALAVANELATRRDFYSAGGMSIRDLNKAEITARNADVVEAMGMLPALVGRWQQSREETDRTLSRATNKAAMFMGVSKTLRMGLQIGVLGLGAYLVIHNELTPGAMIAASILMARALAPVEQAIGGWRQASSTRISYQRLKQQMALAPEAHKAMPLPQPTGKLSAKAATFFFPNAAEPTLRDISFKVQAGKCLGIIGPSAAGKTTLSRMLVGNLVPRHGHIRLDGADVAQLGSTDRGRYLGYLPQDIELFDGTVRENIARMSEGDPERVTEAAIASGIHEMILQLPEGYETEIGPGAAILSGGQRQRIALARAIYGNPSLIVLDEPNANLDESGQAALIKTINFIKERGATLVLVTHSAAMIRQTDSLLVLADGRLKQFGQRDAVLAKLGVLPTRMAAVRPAQEA